MKTLYLANGHRATLPQLHKNVGQYSYCVPEQMSSFAIALVLSEHPELIHRFCHLTEKMTPIDIDLVLDWQPQLAIFLKNAH